MKKFIVMVLCAIIAISMFAACGRFTCEVCGEEKTGKKHEGNLLGYEFVYCDDCYKLGNTLLK